MRASLLLSYMVASLMPHVSVVNADPRPAAIRRGNEATTEYISAVAVMSPTSTSNITGTIIFRQPTDYSELDIIVNLQNVAPLTSHGLHLHVYGDVSDEKGSYMGGHFNPFNKPHGCTGYSSKTTADEYASFHVGDFGTVTSDAHGFIQTQLTRTNVNLESATLSPFSLANVVGHGVVLHANSDDCETQPVGNAGARLAQGVLGYFNGTHLPASYPPSAVDETVEQKATVALMTPISVSGARGYAYFKQSGSDQPVHVTVEIAGLQANSVHGFHIHKFGDISDNAAGQATGGHFNPYNTPHACPPPTQDLEPTIHQNQSSLLHAGDFASITADAAGFARATYTTYLITLYQGQPNTILGRAAVLHANPDDCKSQPSGNAGARLAQGVIGVRNASLSEPGIDEVWFQGFGRVSVPGGEEVKTTLDVGYVGVANTTVAAHGVTASPSPVYAPTTTTSIAAAETSQFTPHFTGAPSLFTPHFIGAPYAGTPTMSAAPTNLIISSTSPTISLQAYFATPSSSSKAPIAASTTPCTSSTPKPSSTSSIAAVSSKSTPCSTSTPAPTHSSSIAAAKSTPCSTQTPTPSSSVSQAPASTKPCTTPTPTITHSSSITVVTSSAKPCTTPIHTPSSSSSIAPASSSSSKPCTTPAKAPTPSLSSSVAAVQTSKPCTTPIIHTPTPTSSRAPATTTPSSSSSSKPCTTLTPTPSSKLAPATTTPCKSTPVSSSSHAATTTSHAPATTAVQASARLTTSNQGYVPTYSSMVVVAAASSSSSSGQMRYPMLPIYNNTLAFSAAAKRHVSKIGWMAVAVFAVFWW